MPNVLITGCSSGFGLLTALEFARRGDRVFATMRDTTKGGELTGTRDAEKLPIDVLQLDVTDQASVDKAVAEVLAHGPIDVLVNNAGFELRGPVEETDDDEVREQFETNVLGLVRVTRAVVPSMRARRSGTIVNLSSIGGVVSVPFEGFYTGSKHAVEAISEALHYELHPHGIRVAIVEPGGFPTNFVNNIRFGRRFTKESPYWAQYEGFQAGLSRMIPGGSGEGGASDPGDVARATSTPSTRMTPSSAISSAPTPRWSPWCESPPTSRGSRRPCDKP